jgi:hypothetical protein
MVKSKAMDNFLQGLQSDGMKSYLESARGSHSINGALQFKNNEITELLKKMKQTLKRKVKLPTLQDMKKEIQSSIHSVDKCGHHKLKYISLLLTNDTQVPHGDISQDLVTIDLQGDNEWLQEVQGTVYLTEGKSTVLYNTAGVPPKPNATDWIAIWESQGYTPPDKLKTWLTEDKQAVTQLNMWGPLIYTAFNRRMKPNIQKRFDMTLMHGCIPHGAPDPNSKFRAVLFFTASPPKPKSQRGASSAKTDYNDEQMSYEKLLWTMTAEFTNSKGIDMEYRESLQFLYRRLGEAIAATGSTIGTSDKTLLEIRMPADLKGMLSNLGKLSIDYFTTKRPTSAKEVQQLIDAVEQYPIMSFYKRMRQDDTNNNTVQNLIVSKKRKRSKGS